MQDQEEYTEFVVGRVKVIDSFLFFMAFGCWGENYTYFTIDWDRIDDSTVWMNGWCQEGEGLPNFTRFLMVIRILNWTDDG